jgi:hypothetical protein
VVFCFINCYVKTHIGGELFITSFIWYNFTHWTGDDWSIRFCYQAIVEISNCWIFKWKKSNRKVVESFGWESVWYEKNTTLSQHFQNPIDKSRKRQNRYPKHTLLVWYRHLNLKKLGWVNLLLWTQISPLRVMMQ